MSIPFSAYADLGEAIPNMFRARRLRPERQRFEVAADALHLPELDDLRHFGFTTRPYLVAHPEREIAEVRWVGRLPHVVCLKCGYGHPHARRDVGWLRDSRYEDAIAAAHRHNAERHPRRWARSQNFSGTVALDGARRVTRWGADA